MVPKLISSTGVKASIREEKENSRTRCFVKHIKKGQGLSSGSFYSLGFHTLHQMNDRQKLLLSSQLVK